ncbi:cell wall-binding repeat-containing protein [Clostridium sp. A1-XYC3]|uniref:Cell wall-binding repeat-containing protein n=1 Tax=Clostridium tanneri TaxID=3037988 RepID=A0ABU4JPN1_9CLOT|nr:cell wall-binding repeat-containing protein [Clostridium sp. A1-XYC3]MDW8800105.1 cell wall-binding repeat-containing protein [Clostridium sp. A1-XYC3]
MKKLVLFIVITILEIGNFCFVHAENSYNVIRISGADRYETSLNVANNFFDIGSKNIIIANGENFADALAGTILSKKLDAPILLVNKNFLEDKNFLNYTAVYSGVSGGEAISPNVYILGGTGSISNDYERISASNLKTIRLSGTDRFSTNSAIVNSVSVEKGTPVIIVNGYQFFDNLSVSSISGIKGYPMIMSTGDKLNDAAAEVIRNIEPSQVFIIGGHGSISDVVVNDIKNCVKNLDDSNITRISGADRYETSLNICKYFNINSATAVIVSGEDFSDALNGSALAAKLNAPIILTDGKDISTQKRYLDTTSYKKIFLVGGKNSITEDVENKLSGLASNTVVTFSDENLEAAIRKSINKANGDLYINDVKNITSLSTDGYSINDLSGIEKLTNLRVLGIVGNNITNIEPLKNLNNLESLYLSNEAELADISALGHLGKLSNLTLLIPNLKDISVLKILSNLKSLSICDSNLTDISELKDCKNLIFLSLMDNEINNINALSELNKLKTLQLYNNQITSISALKSLTNLNCINLADNQITNISDLKDLTNLTKLYLGENKITNIDDLKNLINLSKLDLSFNQITDIRTLENLTNLNELHLNKNKIKNISPLKQLINLHLLFIENNKTSDSDIKQLEKALPNCRICK